MKIDFIIRPAGFEPLHFSNEIPRELDQHFIPGSRCFSAKGTYGIMFFQLIHVDGFSYCLSVLKIEKDCELLVSLPAPFAFIHFDITGRVEHDIQGAGNLFLKDNMFKIVYASSLSSASRLKKDHQYILLDVCFPVGNLLQTLEFFPSLDKFREDVLVNQPSYIPKQNIYVNAAIAELLYKLIHSPFSPSTGNFHLNLIKDVLQKALSVASRVPASENNFSLIHLEKIIAAKGFIDAHLSEHFTVQQIAREAGINEQHLKVGFKNTFGKGLFEYLLFERLYIAKLKIEQTTRPIKEIARSAGYKSPGNFSVAFKKQFGKTPTTWRYEYKIKNRNY